MARTFVLGDLHLTRGTPTAVSADLAQLLAEHPGSRFVSSGDFFDFAVDAPAVPRTSALRALLEAHPAVRTALGEHLTRGGDFVFVGGNHDAEIGWEGLEHALGEALELNAAARSRLTSTPWFLRDGGLHVEHGHLHDPDNAPAHPLATDDRSLGLRFSADFLHPTGAYAYLQATDGTPLSLFVTAFREYGKRAPHVVYRYFRTAFSALAKSGPFRGDASARARQSGEQALLAFAERMGVGPADLDALAQLSAAPRLESLAGTFSRLYLDRVTALLAMAGGLGLAAAGHRRSGAAALSLGALAMSASWAAGRDRYGGSVADQLAAAATRVAAVTGAELVVFGHSHAEARSERYANTGSFAFPRHAPGRPFLEIEGPGERPVAVSRYLTPQR